jgi:hypothetical protein
MKAPKVRLHISLGQRPRIRDKNDHSPEGAGNFRPAPPEMGRPYRANLSVFVSPRALPRLIWGRAVGPLMGFASLTALQEYFLNLSLIHHISVVNQKQTE